MKRRGQFFFFWGGGSPYVKTIDGRRFRSFFFGLLFPISVSGEAAGHPTAERRHRPRRQRRPVALPVGPAHHGVAERRRGRRPARDPSTSLKTM